MKCITEFSSLILWILNVIFVNIQDFIFILSTRHKLRCWVYITWYSKVSFCLNTWEKSETRSSIDPLWEDQQWRPRSKCFWGITINIIADGRGFLCILKETPEKLNWPKSIALILVPFIWLVSLRSQLWPGLGLRFSLFVVCFHNLLSRFFLLDHLISSWRLVLFYHLHRFWQRLTPVFTAHHSWLTIPTP